MLFIILFIIPFLIFLLAIKVTYSISDTVSQLVLGHVVITCLTFLRNCWTFLKWLQHFTFPPAMYKGSDFSTSSPIFVSVCFYYYSHPRVWEVISHCNFDLHFPNEYDLEHLFICFLATCNCIWRNISSNTLLFSKVGLFVFLLLSSLFLRPISYQYMICKYFYPFYRLSFSFS